jgi:signal transduction histidine kinase/CheY-like chemotaxis protein
LYPEAWTVHASSELPVEPLVANWVRPDGSQVWTEQNFTAIRDSNGSIVAIEGIARDITKRRNVEDALREADRRKTEFIAMLSHELRNPLAVIGNGTYMLAQGVLDPDQVRRTLATIERQVVQLTHLIDDLLDITRITRGQIQLQRGLVDVDQLARAAVDDFRSGFPDAKITFDLDLARDRVTVLGDATRIRQVIDNLLHNAMKFTPAGGRVLVSVGVDSTRNEAVLRVHNTGSKIPRDLVTSLFEPFVQADRSLDRRQGGLGLGLAIVKGLVEMHGGSVAVQSDDASGTAFTVRLPSSIARAESSHATPVKPLPVPRTKVLLIEDNADAAEMMRMILELRGHHVMVTKTGREGLEAARRTPPDIVLCDIGLPEMDGYQVARTFRADHALRGVPMIALTGYATGEDVARAREAGFDRHVAKPPEIDVLAALIEELADRPRRDVLV